MWQVGINGKVLRIVLAHTKKLFQMVPKIQVWGSPPGKAEKGKEKNKELEQREETMTQQCCPCLWKHLAILASVESHLGAYGPSWALPGRETGSPGTDDCCGYIVISSIALPHIYLKAPKQDLFCRHWYGEKEGKRTGWDWMLTKIIFKHLD